MIPANYSLARNMARKVLKQYKIVDVPTDLRKIFEGEGLEAARCMKDMQQSRS